MSEDEAHYDEAFKREVLMKRELEDKEMLEKRPIGVGSAKISIGVQEYLREAANSKCRNEIEMLRALSHQHDYDQKEEVSIINLTLICVVQKIYLGAYLEERIKLQISSMTMMISAGPEFP